MANKASNFSTAISLRSYLNDKISNAETGYTGDILKCLNYSESSPFEAKVYDVELIWVGDQFFVDGTFDIDGSTEKKMVPFNNYEWGIEPNRAHIYSIVFDGSGASGSMDSLSCTYNEAVTLPSYGFTAPENTQFSGWAISENGEKVYDDEASVKNLTSEDNGSVTLYAVWIADEQA